jgi:hypothetical protein
MTTATIENDTRKEKAEARKAIREAVKHQKRVGEVKAQARLESNTTDAEATSDNGLTAFNSAGFTLGTLAQVNTNAATYAAWTWDAGSSTVTNTAGSITSSVRANASAGFSIAGFTTPTSGTYSVGHGLNVRPDFVIFKIRGTTGNWLCQHISIGTQYLLLNTTGAAVTDSGAWPSAATSTVVNFGTGLSGYSGATGIMYCFAPVAGYSAFGSYTGNGSADGPFVYTGFRPRWVMVKRATGTSGGSDWLVYDALRPGNNLNDLFLKPNTSDSEQSGSTNNPIDLLSNGFKIRWSTANSNASGETFIFAAFAESPFGLNARAR